MFGLQRFTTIRRVFEEFKMDITQNKFSNLVEYVEDRRDLSDEALKKLWESKPR